MNKAEIPESCLGTKPRGEHLKYGKGMIWKGPATKLLAILEAINCLVTLGLLAAEPWLDAEITRGPSNCMRNPNLNPEISLSLR